MWTAGYGGEDGLASLVAAAQKASGWEGEASSKPRPALPMKKSTEAAGAAKKGKGAAGGLSSTFRWTAPKPKKKQVEVILGPG